MALNCSTPHTKINLERETTPMNIAELIAEVLTLEPTPELVDSTGRSIESYDEFIATIEREIA